MGTTMSPEKLREQAGRHSNLTRNSSLTLLHLRFLGEGKKKKKKKKPKKKKLEQSDPPRTGLSKFYPDGIYPVGEIQNYKDEYVRFSLSFIVDLYICDVATLGG